ncbi:uncharacterized protein STEHIDRAFT_46055 [Stereum hirsutum FP-91666 SS1]|uniref:uncharacterized protein n=1 Tax=Stereum hirsutum (strain FP-91666) TaxID=721885 RepID=UPI000440F8E9|nr:uncharacterized protein STEHIDRAFT_46055 [Stereum hirsutum FP-91666 SS1]EIM92351.1 hypothetical protein STEHIDRAFT_46055 [Stereum hirsutum FP-91666 SS1]
MASSLLKASSSKFPLRVAQSSVRYAKAGGREANADPLKESIRRALYPPNIRSKPTPTGTWRPDVGRALQIAIPSKQAHETIERAWALHKRHLRQKRNAEMQRKYEHMKRAMDELEKIDPHLFQQANKHVDPRVRTQEEMEALRSAKGRDKMALEARPPGLFPRELRVPSDTPSRDGWNYEFVPNVMKRRSCAYLSSVTVCCDV